MALSLDGTTGITSDGGTPVIENLDTTATGVDVTGTLVADGVQVDGGTANGVAYLNGSKVLTSGSALNTNGSSLAVGSSDYGSAGSINVSVGAAGVTTGGLQLWSSTTGQHYVQFGDGTAGAATYAGAIGYSHATDQMFFYANGSEQMRLDSSGNFKFNSGYGSAATAYGCRAWVNFDGTGTVAIRASGNVSSISDNGTGDYTVNFTTAMVDINYSVSASCGSTGSIGALSANINSQGNSVSAPTTGSTRVSTLQANVGVIDSPYVNVAIFR